MTTRTPTSRRPLPPGRLFAQTLKLLPAVVIVVAGTVEWRLQTLRVQASDGWVGATALASPAVRRARRAPARVAPPLDAGVPGARTKPT